MDNNYEATVDGKFEFQFSQDDINNIDIIAESGNKFHIIKGHQAFQAEIIHTDFQKKTFIINVNGNKQEVKLANQFDQLVKKLGLSVVSNQKINDIKAPMPGLVLEVAVSIGQTVEKGDALLILEAMKMENVIKSAGEGVVKAIHVENGTAVDKGQLLLELD